MSKSLKRVARALAEAGIETEIVEVGQSRTAQEAADAVAPESATSIDAGAFEAISEPVADALRAKAEADAAAADSPLHDLGLGVYLAHSRASALLPDDYELPEDVDLLADLEERTPLQLLTEAEELTRPLPLHRPDLVHGSQLVVDLCDLIREARGLGY